ncbi:MAG TPA: Gfo/Idh/MocA family oxidoreductase [Rectinemataceae bacterium]|nr:Gfo/Idh/MocA family oxidoreductase [Rectinemataceae bacterium]
MDDIAFGLYGYGKVAELHARALSRTPGARLVSVCGRDAAKRDAFAARWDCASRSSPAELADRDRVAALVVTTPHPFHAAHAIESFEAGLHVLIEKPLALRVEECDAMIAAAARARRRPSLPAP